MAMAVKQTGSLTTASGGVIGILAQSIGAGGGAGENGLVDLDVTGVLARRFRLSGGISGGTKASGNGGAVRVTTAPGWRRRIILDRFR